MTFSTRSGEKAQGYRGIWFRLGQLDGKHGDKYSGGLGTYTSKHVPTAIYAPEVDKTFFAYGGTPEDTLNLQIMVSWYDHAKHEVPRPTIVDRKTEPNPGYDSETVVDPHDNASMAIDNDGFVWIFVSGRGPIRPGRVYRSREPYSVSAFALIQEWDRFAYPQPWWLNNGIVVCYTEYDDDWNRHLYWKRSQNGRTWSNPSQLAGFGGHYQVSEVYNDAIVTAFNWHPDGVPDRRTNLYALRTDDHGETWETLSGSIVDPPLEEPSNDALVIDYAARDRLVFLNDVMIDENGNPAILYVTSGGYEPGPSNDPRQWKVTFWSEGEWITRIITESDHNYDSGSLYLKEDGWRVIGPTESGPQPYHTGGEMAVWKGTDQNKSWERTHAFPTFDGFNMTYARRPRSAQPRFEGFWADGDASRQSESRLYFGSLDGGLWRLPIIMEANRSTPPQVA